MELSFRPLRNGPRGVKADVWGLGKGAPEGLRPHSEEHREAVSARAGRAEPLPSAAVRGNCFLCG